MQKHVYQIYKWNIKRLPCLHSLMQNLVCVNTHRRGSGLHELSSSPKFTRVFASGYMKTWQALHIFLKYSIGSTVVMNVPFGREQLLYTVYCILNKVDLGLMLSLIEVELIWLSRTIGTADAMKTVFTQLPRKPFKMGCSTQLCGFGGMNLRSMGRVSYSTFSATRRLLQVQSERMCTWLPSPNFNA